MEKLRACFHRLPGTLVVEGRAGRLVCDHTRATIASRAAASSQRPTHTGSPAWVKAIFPRCSSPREAASSSAVHQKVTFSAPQPAHAMKPIYDKRAHAKIGLPHATSGEGIIHFPDSAGRASRSPSVQKSVGCRDKRVASSNGGRLMLGTSLQLQPFQDEPTT